MNEEMGKDKLSDRQLDELLRDWPTPAAPSRELRAAIFGESASPREAWWLRLWCLQLRLPAPAFAMVLLALALMGWRWSAAELRPPQVIVEHRTEIRTVEVAANNAASSAPGVKPAVCRRRPSATSANAGAFGGMRPEAELRTRVIQGGYEQN